MPGSPSRMSSRTRRPPRSATSPWHPPTPTWSGWEPASPTTARVPHGVTASTARPTPGAPGRTWGWRTRTTSAAFRSTRETPTWPTSRRSATCGDPTRSGASIAPPTGARAGNWCSSWTRTPAPSTSSWTCPTRGRSSRPCTSAGGARGDSTAAARGAGSTAPSTAATPGRNSPTVSRQATRGGSASTSTAATATWSSRWWKRTPAGRDRASGAAGEVAGMTDRPASTAPPTAVSAGNTCPPPTTGPCTTARFAWTPATRTASTWAAASSTGRRTGAETSRPTPRTACIWTTTRSGSTPPTRTTSSWRATAASRSAGTARTTGTSCATCPLRSSTKSAWTCGSPTTSAAVCRTTVPGVRPPTPGRTRGSARATGTTWAAATASSPSCTPPTPTSCSPNRRAETSRA